MAEELKVSDSLTVLFEENGHIYRTSDGREVLSVTQLMKKHGLGADYSGVSKEYLTYKAELGTEEHNRFETFIKSNGKEFSASLDVMWFNDNVYHLFKDWESEIPILTIGLPVDYAGRIDLICKTFGGKTVIMDIKRTSTIHKHAVSWQLSLYRYALAQIRGIAPEEINLYCIQAKGEFSKIVDIEPIPTSEVVRLLECEKAGMPYVPSEIVLSESQFKAALDFQKSIEFIDRQKKEVEKNFAATKEEILAAMSKFGVNTLTLGPVTLSRVAPYVRESINSEKVCEDYPAIKNDSKYWKKTNVKQSLRITVKEKKEDDGEV